MAGGEEGLVQEPGDTPAEAPPEVPSMQHPLMTVLEGQGLSADDAAWSMVADAAEVGLTLPDLSPASRADLTDLWVACRRAAGLPCELRLQRGGAQLQA
jgi:hypothetical protein